ncbi:hypothetical protein DB88DRAFT_472707 [Papiliotrema laurentii]|uniref:CCHC-type domain-containing protein n=1 Tax=Papiliotrema laurentii TaxID=5418 RepID=A0AAD9D0X3_PAPLA|nr:hypothetical protein DB88DRAFT_472707 [Papiliotrema laurentii]
MPPRPALPRLTLYTGGKECSLCEVFKDGLAVVKRTHPFDLEYWNIRDPPPGVEEREAKKWRRLYQYDIESSLTAACIAFRREEDPEASHRHPGVAGGSGGMARIEQAGRGGEVGEGSGGVSVNGGFRPYRSIIPSLSPSPSPSPPTPRSPPSTSTFSSTTTPHAFSPQSPTKRPKLDPSPPSPGVAPWRAAVGRGFFALPNDPSSSLLPGEEDLYVDILLKTFSNFNDDPVGAEAERLALSGDSMDSGDWFVDVEAKRGVVDGDPEVIYDTLTSIDALQLDMTPSKHIDARAARRACWNCGEVTHQLAHCPHPRDPAMIQRSRAAFLREKEIAETTMPAYHRPYLSHYICTAQDRQRRLDLAERFSRPGRPSAALLDAVFSSGQDDEDTEDADVFEYNALSQSEADIARRRQERRMREEERVSNDLRRERGQLPWFARFMQWGYPPGWISERDPVEEAKRRIRIDPLTDNVDDDSDEEDDLVVYGDATALPLPDKMDPSHQSPDIPGDPPPPPPPQPDEAPPPPPPPVDRPYRKWWELPPPRPLPPTGPNDRRDQSVGGPRTRRWAWYDTDMFSSERLRPYDTIRHVPLSIALPMRLDQTPTRRR